LFHQVKCSAPVREQKTELWISRETAHDTASQTRGCRRIRTKYFTAVAQYQTPAL
jgi:hypothetical protein